MEETTIDLKSKFEERKRQMERDAALSFLREIFAAVDTPFVKAIEAATLDGIKQHIGEFTIGDVLESAQHGAAAAARAPGRAKKAGSGKSKEAAAPEPLAQ